MFRVPADTDGQGTQVWIYVQNASSIAWVSGHVVTREAGSLDYTCTVAPCDALCARIVGVATHPLSPGSFAWVWREVSALYWSNRWGTAELALWFESVSGASKGHGPFPTFSVFFKTPLPQIKNPYLYC